MSANPIVSTVHFFVECAASLEESIWLCGDPPLGNWDARGAVKLDREDSKWRVTLPIPTGIRVSYKYLKRGPKMLRWEAGNRSLHITGIEMHVNDHSFRTKDGLPDSSVVVDEGWLHHEEAMLSVHLGQMDKRNPGKMLSAFLPCLDGVSPGSVRMKCGGHSSEILSLCEQFQGFHFFSPSVEQFCVEVRFYSHEEDKRKRVGSVMLIADDFASLGGILTRPVLNSGGQMVGKFYCTFQVIFPFVHPKNSVTSLWEEHQKAPLPSVNMIGHRGCGANVRGPHFAISENTILSFLTAAQFGVEYVECDIQMTRDGVPVIHHNYEIKVNGIPVAISHLNFNEFTKLKPEQSPRILRKLCKARSLDDIHHNERMEFKSLEFQIIHEGFSSLAETLRRVPKEVGFLIEIKYPSEYCRSTRRIVSPERNEFVDAVLKVVFGAESRKVIFISFDPTICTMLRQKQNCFPVFFLTSIMPGEVAGDPALEYDFDHWDTRCITFDNAIAFAERARLRGLIASASSALLQPEVIAKAHGKGLLFCTYGKDNSNPETAKHQKELGVDALIVDNILKTTKHLRQKEQISNMVIADNLLNVRSTVPDIPK